MLMGQQKSGKSFGVQTAPVQIDVYSDFQCPACKNLHDGVLHQIQNEYVRTGKVYLTYREFPLPMHKYAREAASLATAAARLNKYEPVAGALFRQQATWSNSGNLESAIAPAITPAELQKIKALAKDPQVQSAIEQDIALGKQNSLAQTPTLIIMKNMRRFPIGGNVSYEVLKRFLDSLLSQ